LRHFADYLRRPPYFSALGVNDTTGATLYAIDGTKTGCFAVAYYGEKVEKGNPWCKFFDSPDEFETI
jgi:hypothetical protein